MPEEPLREQLGPSVVRRPPLDCLRRVVDDPILGNAMLMIATMRVACPTRGIYSLPA
jgi:hypothetical protein